MNDPLAQFRRKPIVPLAQTVSGAAAAAPEGYEAFGAKDKVLRLQIRLALAPCHSPGYAYLLDISYDGPFGTNFVLAYTFMNVLVRGKNLQPVIAALEAGKADFIQEYHADLWPRPAANVPVIESIRIMPHDDRLLANDTRKTK